MRGRRERREDREVAMTPFTAGRAAERDKERSVLDPKGVSKLQYTPLDRGKGSKLHILKETTHKQTHGHTHTDAR